MVCKRAVGIHVDHGGVERLGPLAVEVGEESGEAAVEEAGIMEEFVGVGDERPSALGEGVEERTAPAALVGAVAVPAAGWKTVTSGWAARKAGVASVERSSTTRNETGPQRR